MKRLRPRFRVRQLRDPVGLLLLSYLVHRRDEQRVGGQLVEVWRWVGGFQTWELAMHEVTGQYPYADQGR